MIQTQVRSSYRYQSVMLFFSFIYSLLLHLCFKNWPLSIHWFTIQNTKYLIEDARQFEKISEICSLQPQLSALRLASELMYGTQQTAFPMLRLAIRHTGSATRGSMAVVVYFTTKIIFVVCVCNQVFTGIPFYFSSSRLF